MAMLAMAIQILPGKKDLWKLEVLVEAQFQKIT